MGERTYIAIDLKSFYASVECRDRGLDPMTTNLVVADSSRTEKTICLAVSPSLKAYGIPGRPRLFEVVQQVKLVNCQRQARVPGRKLVGSSSDDTLVKAHPELALGYIVAPPRMASYMEWSSRVFQVYLKYIAPEDIHPYSIDEVFIDATNYLKTYKLTPRELAQKMILDVLATTGITATAGIGTNLYLCKVAMDIVAKHVEADQNGVRIAQLNERSYRELLWDHRPITDFWRVGPGYAKKLASVGLHTMGDVARCSLGHPPAYHSEELLYRLFGVNAELLIDHAWGWEPCTMADIKSYRPEYSSICSGQVLQCPYSSEKARLVVKEMGDALALELVDKGIVTDQLTLTIGYDIENLKDPARRREYRGPVQVDRYGRAVPKHAHGTANLGRYTASSRLILGALMDLFDRTVDPHLLVRRCTITANRLLPEREARENAPPQQLDLFADHQQEEQEEQALTREKNLQSAMLTIKKKYGKNAILKANDLEDGATAITRNSTIGGHRA